MDKFNCKYDQNPSKIDQFTSKTTQIVLNKNVSTLDLELDGFCHSKLLESDFELLTIKFGMANHLSLDASGTSSKL